MSPILHLPNLQGACVLLFPTLSLTDAISWLSAMRHDNRLGESLFILVLTPPQHSTIAWPSQHATSAIYHPLLTIKSIPSLSTVCDDVINTSVLSDTCQSASAHDPGQ